MKQIRLFAPAIIFVFLFSSNALAHPVMKDEVLSTPIKPTHNWTGFYAGLNVGLVNHTMNVTDTYGTTFLSTIEEESNPRFTGGFQAGYRYQLDPTKTSGVFGLELSTNFSNAPFEKVYGSPFAQYQLQSENKLKNVTLLEAMGGIAADKTFLFLAAGLSWVDISGDTTSLDGAPFFNSFSMAKKTLGTAIGAGIEYAFCDRLSARFKVDVVTPDSYSTYDNTDDNFQISNSIVQGSVGINYNFA